jgi:type II secretory pathway predicted ATPase ExeA
MKDWQVNNQAIFEIGPLTEYLAALRYTLRCEGDERRLLLVVGDPGTGKTVGARIFRQEQTVKSPIYLSLPAAGILRPRDLLDLLGRPVGLSFDLHYPRYEVGQQLARDSLARPRIFLLDEAQALAKGGLLDMIRWLHDTGGHTFVLIGPPALEHALLDHREVAGRVVLRHQLRLPTVEEIEPFFPGFPSEAIEQIHQETGGRMREVIALRDWITELADQHKLSVPELRAKQVQVVARHVLVKVA